MSEGVRNVVFITLPASTGLIALGKPLIRLIYEQGKFTPQATEATAFALFFYSLGIFAYSAIHVLSRTFYALKDTITPVIVGSIAMIINIIFSLLLIGPLKHGGLALAYSMAGVVNMLVLLGVLRHKIGSINGRVMLISFIKSLIASVLMGLVVYSFTMQLEKVLDISSKLNQGLIVMGGIILGVLIYMFLAFIFQMEEAKTVGEIIKGV